VERGLCRIKRKNCPEYCHKRLEFLGKCRRLFEAQHSVEYVTVSYVDVVLEITDLCRYMQTDAKPDQFLRVNFASHDILASV
jgi:hypothetical protein